MPSIQWNAFRSRLARRLSLSFVACALLPFLVAGIAGYYELRRFSDQRAVEHLKDFSSRYGMAVIGNLTAADTVLRALASQPTESRAVMLERAANFEAFRKIRYVTRATAPPGAPAERTVPWPSAEQQHALRDDRTVLLAGRDAIGSARVYLVRSAPQSNAWLYAELDPVLLWDVSEAHSDSATAVVITAAGHVLQVSGALPDDMVERIALSARTSGPASASGVYLLEHAGSAWQTHTWEAFLTGAFSTPSWYVVGLQPRTALRELGRLHLILPALLALTLLAALWLLVWRVRRYLAPLEDLTAGTRRLARREFDVRVHVSADDEIAELADSFNRMAESLEQQFDALETMGEVDRLLLRSPGLERVLDALLPRMASVLHTDTVSVLLTDGDAPGRARIYEHARQRSGAMPVRRITVEIDRIQAILASGATFRLTEDRSRESEFLEAVAELGARYVHLWPLERGAELAGLLCLGFLDDRALDESTTKRARDFADRLAVVLANVEHQQILYRQAHYDALTGLPNRRLLSARLANALAASTGGALLYVDVDDFKRVNDTAGHSTGDELLEVVGQRLAACLKECDTVARLGGDEFAVLMNDVSDPLRVRAAADRILTVLAKPVSVGGRDHYISASIGVTLFPGDGNSIEDLLRNSDIAMYRAKDQGRGRLVFFEAAMNERMIAREALETELHRALQMRKFELHYQPIVSTATNRLVGIEALLRWPSAAPEHASPAVFIPTAEESGLILEIGNWVLDTACKTLGEWMRGGLEIPYVSVNVSVRQLREPDFTEQVANALRRHNLSPQALQLEITESVLAEGEHAGTALARLAQLGVTIALDDFGTGYSSLSYLRTYPIDTVKIDRSFIQDVPQSAAACKLVEAIVAMGHSLKKQVVAEGVETPEQLGFLHARGCDGVQGFLLAPALSREDLERYARKEREVRGLRRVS